MFHYLVFFFNKKSLYEFLNDHQQTLLHLCSFLNSKEQQITKYSIYNHAIYIPKFL